MSTRYYSWFFVVVLSCITACGSGTGKDALQNIRPPARQSQSACLTCHASPDIPAVNPLISGGTGTAGKHVKHVSERGIDCEFCHYGYLDKPSHMNGILDTPDPAVTIVFFNSTNPTGTWTGDTGPGTGTCSSLSCHGSDSLEWYSTAGWTLPTCSACHTSARGPRRSVLGLSGDFGSNSSNSSHHVAGATDPTPVQCLACHDRYRHMTGTIYLKSVDTPSDLIVYDPNDPSSLEPFCLGCHDTDGAAGEKSPFADGRTLGAVPNAAGDKIAGYWSATYTVHKDNGLTCAGTGAPNTGCHGNNQTINMHGSVSKGLLTRNMTLPIPAAAPYAESQYQLCFDCHANYSDVTKEVVLGYKQGGHYDVTWAPSPYSSPTTTIRSHFRDRYISSASLYPSYWLGVNQAYNDNFFTSDPYTPLHNYHLSPTDGWMQNIWDYRGSGTTGRASCVTCHNVHGSNTPVRSVYDEFGLVRGSNFGIDEYVALTSPNTLDTFPINCTYSCHGIYGVETFYWHTPADE
jgi:hypothetical protein